MVEWLKVVKMVKCQMSNWPRPLFTYASYSSNQFFTMVFPSGVSTLSGWN